MMGIRHSLKLILKEFCFFCDDLLNFLFPENKNEFYKNAKYVSKFRKSVKQHKFCEKDEMKLQNFYAEDHDRKLSGSLS